MDIKLKTNTEILEYRIMVNTLYDYYHNLAMASEGYKDTKEVCDIYKSKMAKYSNLKDKIIKDIERRVNEEIMA